MKIAASILDCKNRVNSVLELNRTNISYVHIDVMDGKFVPSVHFDNIGEIRGINLVTKYPMDVHLMMDNPSDYIKELGNMNIEFITIHLEIDKDLKEIFKSIKDLGYKVGLSIKPNTNIKDIEPYLDDIDMVLVMSVEPGLGGQSFIESTVDRIKELKELTGSRNVLIEVDGGINNETITKLEDVDIAVVGSYIVKSDNYYRRVEELLKTMQVGIIEDVKINEKKIKPEILIIKILFQLWFGAIPFVYVIKNSLDFAKEGLYIDGSGLSPGWDSFIFAFMFLSFIFSIYLLIGLLLIIFGIKNIIKLIKQNKG